MKNKDLKKKTQWKLSDFITILTKSLKMKRISKIIYSLERNRTWEWVGIVRGAEKITKV